MQTKLSIIALTLTVALSACSEKATDAQKDQAHVKAVSGSNTKKNKDESISARAKSIKEQEDNAPSNPLKNAYFGETHMHTKYSLDAYIGGNRMSPKDSLQFAQGQEKMINGELHKLHRPLDFAATTDHSEYIGEMYTTLEMEAVGHNNETLKELRSLSEYKDQIAWFVKYVISVNRGDAKPSHPPFYTGAESTKSAWQIILQAAKEEYKPGVFTTLAAFEWSGAPKGGNLHRNILFRDMVVPAQPMSYLEINREDDLWLWLAEQEKQGSTVLAIPHNSNASKLNMFNPNDAKGKPITKEYAELRSHFERTIEMMQIKGNSEVHRNFWPADEFADFENADSVADFSNRGLDKRNFVRWGVIEGLKHYQNLGVNPYKLGFNGGTDSHNGLMADVAEDNYVGGHGAADHTPELRRTGQVPEWLDAIDESIGSITGVWAQKNTRSEIWDAMYNRETFATSGPRMQIRFFAGEHLTPQPSDIKAMVTEGYDKGVPMGGTVTGADSAPTLTVWAAKDTVGANLDRIQIIKGWVDQQGEQHEKIINVVWSDNRAKDKKGNLAQVGNTVDLTTAKYTNEIGATMLMGSFTDEEFNSELPTLYYARVIEIPTPRWSTYDAVRNNLPLLKDVPATIQERAWSSPIWFMPTQEKTH
ncbi:DUF3604 domain-containing protein [Colwellia psychrerythraea]|uniref:DUF3604 domain-containing protein n=1 Tax=Colwellia psychrerythraea TaxID=28229 RepID=A0A099KAG9_COLPS|nr:DUF3604 domain-containing protein [Colwellia psychrerythraea]KGJ87351.1 Protein of unknown function DUF3604 [Colwellia psychrerythraea]